MARVRGYVHVFIKVVWCGMVRYSVGLYVCMRVRACLHMIGWYMVYVCYCMCTRTCRCTCMHVYVYVYAYVYVYVYMHVCVCRGGSNSCRVLLSTEVVTIEDIYSLHYKIPGITNILIAHTYPCNKKFLVSSCYRKF